MKRISFITPELRRLDGLEMDVLALFHFSEKRPLSGIASLVDWRFHGYISKLIIDGFLTGDEEETLLIPANRRLSQKYLLVFGVGPRLEFGKREFTDGLQRMFQTTKNLLLNTIVVALPGRPENVTSAPHAMEWFLSCYEEQSDTPDISIVEPTGAQKAILPIAERWRLRQLVP